MRRTCESPQAFDVRGTNINLPYERWYVVDPRVHQKAMYQSDLIGQNSIPLVLTDTMQICLHSGE